MSFFKNLLGGGSQEFTKVENDQKFNFMLQQMQGNRWKITLIILLTFFFIIFGIDSMEDVVRQIVWGATVFLFPHRYYISGRGEGHEKVDRTGRGRNCQARSSRNAV